MNRLGYHLRVDFAIGSIVWIERMKKNEINNKEISGKYIGGCDVCGIDTDSC